MFGYSLGTTRGQTPMVLHMQQHKIASYSLLKSDHSIDVPADIVLRSATAPDSIVASFSCPYCSAEGHFYGPVHSAGLLVLCEQTERDLGVQWPPSGTT